MKKSSTAYSMEVLRSMMYQCPVGLYCMQKHILVGSTIELQFVVDNGLFLSKLLIDPASFSCLCTSICLVGKYKFTGLLISILTVNPFMDFIFKRLLYFCLGNHPFLFTLIGEWLMWNYFEGKFWGLHLQTSEHRPKMKCSVKGKMGSNVLVQSK